jgi:hypothetical protein
MRSDEAYVAIADCLYIALEVADINRVETNDGREETDVRLSQGVSN